MATDVLSEKLESRLRLTTKTVGEDRIKRAKEKGEDVAVLSVVLPGDATFRCAAGDDCQDGDASKAAAGYVTVYTSLQILLYLRS